MTSDSTLILGFDIRCFGEPNPCVVMDTIHLRRPKYPAKRTMDARHQAAEFSVTLFDPPTGISGPELRARVPTKRSLCRESHLSAESMRPIWALVMLSFLFVTLGPV